MKYTLYDNKITLDNTEDCYARPVDVKMNTREELIANLTRTGSILKPTECRAVIDGYWREIGNFIARGEGYRDEYLSVRFDINGVFDHAEDRFDPARHTLTVSASLAGELIGKAQAVGLQYEKVVADKPVIESVYDWGSDTTNEQLTPNDTIEIRGEELKVYDKEGEGVFFVNQNTGVEQAADRLRTNEPKTLSLRVPMLSPGQYRIEIRNTTRNGKLLRSGIFTQTLAVS